jgi:hypothetical protein
MRPGGSASQQHAKFILKYLQLTDLLIDLL